MSINRLTVLLDKINNSYTTVWKVSKLCIFFNYYRVVLNLGGEREGAPIVEWRVTVITIHALVPLRVLELKMTIVIVFWYFLGFSGTIMSEIHAGRNDFSRGICTSWSNNEHLRHPQNKFLFLFLFSVFCFCFKNFKNQFLQFLWVNHFPLQGVLR